jgi:beta-lactamase class A
MPIDAAEVAATQARIAAAASAVKGIVGVYAKDLASGAEIAHNADTVFPTASVMKIPILYELYRQVEAGTVDLGTRVTLGAEQMVPGSGILQDLDLGLSPTVKDLATLMITVSDNAATDLVLAQIDLASLAATLRGLGLTRTEIPLTVRALLYDTVGLDAANPEHTYELYLERSRAGVIDWNCRAYADEGNNVSTPREMATLLELIERRQGLSTASCDAMIDIMKRQKYTDRIPRQLPEGTDVAHKTGSLRGIRNDAGIVYAPDGPYVISLFAKRLADPVAGVNALAEISQLVWEGLCRASPEDDLRPDTGSRRTVSVR